MKLDSPWFDRIRSTRRRSASRTVAPDICEHPGCDCTGGFRAPKGRKMEGQYHNFCQDHARQYNQSYNYFADMPDEKVAEWQKADYVGHRPTWSMGIKGTAGAREAQLKRPGFSTDEASVKDPFGFFHGTRSSAQHAEAEEARTVRNAERQAFEQLGLDISASAEQIKAQFKLLAKRLHPDANGGDRSTEDKLRAVIQAYNYLKQTGFC